MEAKDTVMKPVEPCIGCPNMQVDKYGYFCDIACGKRTAWLNQMEGYQAGIREVVEQLEYITRREDGVRVHSIHQIFLYVLDIIDNYKPN